MHEDAGTLLTAGAKLDETRSIALRARDRRCSAICCKQQNVIHMSWAWHTSAVANPSVLLSIYREAQLGMHAHS